MRAEIRTTARGDSRLFVTSELICGESATHGIYPIKTVPNRNFGGYILCKLCVYLFFINDVLIRLLSSISFLCILF